MRGGRGGRGRGRYGGRSSVTQELIRDNIEDLGLEFTAFDDKDKVGPPPLYPIPTASLVTAMLHPPQPNNDHKYAIEKTMEFSKRCFQSPYNLDNITNDDNGYINPYNNDNNKSNNNVPKELLELICKGQDEGYPYVPDELIYGISMKNKMNTSKKRNVDINLQKFELAEEGKTEGGIRYDGENKNEEDDEDNDNIEIDPDELEMDDDYIVDHNESEDDNDNDNEAIY